MNLSTKLALAIFLGILTTVILSIIFIFPLFDQPHVNITNENIRNLYIQTFLKIFLLISLVIVPTSFILWLVVLKFMINPIILMNRIIRIIAKGNLGEKIPVKSADEIGELGQNLNTLIHNLAIAFQSMATSLRNEKDREKELAESLKHIEKEKAQDEALLTSMGDAVIAINQDRKIVIFNRAASQLTRYTADEALNSSYDTILKFLNEKDDEPAEDFIKRSFGGEIYEKSEHLMILRKDDEKIPVSPSVGLILSPGKKVNGLVVVLRDITEERKLDRLKDEFVSVASHELRTPMSAIKSLISMIFDKDFGPISSGLEDPLKDMALSIDRLIQLVNDMLDVSRIEAGRVKISLSDVPVKDVIEESVDLMKPLAKQKELAIEIEPFELNIVQADPNKFKQIINNLIGNAIKFTDKGKITVSSYKDNEQLVNISITDTGVGIAPQDKDKLFAKFSQIFSSQQGKPAGTGLGLYISREFARKMGGDLWIDHSEVGKGSTFTFSLPIAGSILAEKMMFKIKNQS